MRTFLFAATLFISIGLFAQKDSSTKNDLTIRKSIIIKGGPLTVWDAITKPEITKKYFFGCEVISDWNEGSPVVYKKKGKEIVKGKVIKVIPGKYLQITAESAKTNDSNYTLVTYALSFQNGETTLSLIENNFTGKDAKKKFKKSKLAWGMVLKKMKKTVENK